MLRIVCLVLLAWLLPNEAHGRRRVVARLLPPAIEAIEPGSGPIGGGTTVTIRGSGFSRDDLSVYFDDEPATSLTYVGVDELRATAPPHANGYVPVRVVNRGRSAWAEFLYTPPSLDSIAIGAITTVAGVGLYLAEGGSAIAAPFDVAGGDIAVQSDGSVLVIEGDRFVVRKIAPDGIVTRFAGRGFPLSPSEVAANDIGDGRLATDAAAGGRGITVGPDGSVYLATFLFHRIRRVDRHTGIISTVAGSGPITFEGAFSGDGGPAMQARLDQPNQVRFDRNGNMYILDAWNQRIRRVTTDGIINTIAGNGTRGFSGDGGPAILASFNSPGGDSGTVKIDRTGDVLFTDVENRRIRKVAMGTGIITTIAGGGTRNEDGVLATDAGLQGVEGLAVAADGTIYFGEASRIRRIDLDGRVRTLFGELTPGFSEDGARNGRLAFIGRMEIDANRNRLLFLELHANRVRSIDLATGTLATVAGIGPATFGENGPAIAAELDLAGPPIGSLAVAADGGLLVGGLFGRLRKLQPDGTLRTIAGGGLGFAGPPPTERPALGVPIPTTGVAVATNGDIYVSGGFEVGRITPDGMYRRIAGGAYGYSGDGGPASAATFDNVGNIAIDPSGNLFIADTWNHCIRRIDAQSGIITTFAGISPPHPPNVRLPNPNPSSGDGGRAVDAQLSFPNFVAADAAGNVYVSDIRGVRMIDRNGIIDTVLAGCTPGPLASDPIGRVFVRCGTGRIVRIEGKDKAIVVGGTSNRVGFSGDGGPASEAETRDIDGMAIDRDGNVYLMDWENRRVRAIRGIAR